MITSRLNVNIIKKSITRRLLMEKWLLFKIIIIIFYTHWKDIFNIWNIHHHLYSLINVPLSYYIFCILSLNFSLFFLKRKPFSYLLVSKHFFCIRLFISFVFKCVRSWPQPTYRPRFLRRPLAYSLFSTGERNCSKVNPCE